MKLSEEASYWLEYFITNPTKRINSTTLMVMGVPRRKSQNIVGELLRANVIQKVTHAGGGSRFIISDTTTVVVSDTTAPVVSGYSYIGHSASTAIVPIAVQPEIVNIATNKFLDGVKEEGEEVGYDFFEKTSGEDSDLLQARQKHEAKKKAEYAEARTKKAEDRKVAHRSKVDPSAWTCKDIAYEFADRLSGYWEIAPFSVTQTRFVQALATFRRQHDTDGAIELALVDLFFENLRSEKITDGNHAWRSFMFKAAQLLPTARERVITPEQLETAIIEDTARAERKLSLFDEDDDV